jgi:hypothetical protein
MHDRACAHRTRLQGHEECAIREAVVAEQRSGGTHGLDLCVRRWIVPADWRIKARPDNLVGFHYNGSNRDFPGF